MDAGRSRYTGSVAEDVVRRLVAVDFGNRIILFGAAILLSVLPVMVLLSALANSQVDDDLGTVQIIYERAFELDHHRGA